MLQHDQMDRVRVTEIGVVGSMEHLLEHDQNSCNDCNQDNQDERIDVNKYYCDKYDKCDGKEHGVHEGTKQKVFLREIVY